MTGPNAADWELARKASRSDLPVTGWQIERWRQRSLLPWMERTGTGLGRGRALRWESHYPEHAVAQARCLAEMLREYGALDRAALAMFIRGFNPRERGVKWAFRTGFKRIDRELETLGTNPHAQAERFASKTTRLSRERSTRSELYNVTFNIASAALGFDLVLLPETADALGITPALEHARKLEAAAGLPSPPLGGDLARWAKEAKLPNLTSVVERASMAELQTARDLLRPMLPILIEMLKVFERNTGLQLPASEPLAALAGIPCMVIAYRKLVKTLGRTLAHEEREELLGGIEDVRRLLPRVEEK